MSKGRLILVGENRLFREGLGHVLANETITIEAQVSYLSEVVPILRSAGPSADLIVYDKLENSIDDFNTLKEIGQEFTHIGIVILTDHADRAGLDLAVAGGARGFLPKSISGTALRLSIELILLGENLFAGPSLQAGEQLTTVQPLADAQTKAPRAQLSPREQEILNCLELGMPNKTIARNLDMAEATVKVHLKSVLRKINAGNRTQAAVWAKSNPRPLLARPCG
jgi:two-component system nitrate/nitrite response regulator NarL